MRIIAGSRKGLRLEAPPGQAVRPTSDRAREALMSALGGFFDGERVLELCAGTGAMSLELLSRGCASAVLVECDRQALACLRRNLARAGMEARGEVLACDVRDALDRLERRAARFDLVYFDPPWDSDLYAPVLQRLARGGLLADDGVLIVESPQPLDPEVLQGRWRSVSCRRYGAAVLDRLVHARAAPATDAPPSGATDLEEPHTP